MWYYFVCDEAHLLDEWGQDFRRDFRDVHFICASGPPHLTFLGLTATLEPGHQEAVVFQRLALRDGYFHYERRDCARKNVDYIVRSIQHPFSGTEMRDLDWLAHELEGMSSPKQLKKCLIFTNTIEFSHRLSQYLRTHLPENLRHKAHELVRRMHSINCDDCKKDAREALYTPSDSDMCSTAVFVSTAIVEHGIDVPDINEVIAFVKLPSPALLNQRKGRIMRNQLRRGRFIVYIKRSEIEAALKWVEDNKDDPRILHERVPERAPASVSRPPDARESRGSGKAHADDEDMMGIDIDEGGGCGDAREGEGEGLMDDLGDLDEFDEDVEDGASEVQSSSSESSASDDEGEEGEVIEDPEEAELRDALDVAQIFTDDEDGPFNCEHESEVTRATRSGEIPGELDSASDDDDVAALAHIKTKKAGDQSSRYILLSAQFRGVCITR